jgi:hypothetical protein
MPVLRVIAILQWFGRESIFLREKLKIWPLQIDSVLLCIDLKKATRKFPFLCPVTSTLYWLICFTEQMVNALLCFISFEWQVIRGKKWYWDIIFQQFTRGNIYLRRQWQLKFFLTNFDRCDIWDCLPLHIVLFRTWRTV